MGQGGGRIPRLASLVCALSIGSSCGRGGGEEDPPPPADDAGRSDAASEVPPADAGLRDGSVEDASARSIAVFIIAGQSNAVGGASVTDLPPEMLAYADPFPMKYAEQLNAPKDYLGGPAELTTDWLDEVAPRDGTLFGIELSASRRLQERVGGELALVKHATNGSSLFANWDTATDNSLWEYMTAFVDARLAELPAGAQVAGMFWIQGNGDAQLKASAEDYAENLGWLIMRVRRKYGCVPVVIDRLHPATQYDFGDEVRAEQDQVAAFVGDVAVVDTSDLTLRDDPPQHYSAASFVLLGERMVDAMPSCSRPAALR